METNKIINSHFNEASATLSKLPSLSTEIEKVYQTMSACLSYGGTIFLCGNGGSAADAQHVATELVVRFNRTRKGIPAIALTTDTSILTAAGNDLGYENIFSRQVESLMKPDDLLAAISTSGKSANVLNAVESAQKIGAKTIAFTGSPGLPLAKKADLSLIIPSNVTARIQEAHILIWHILCDLLELEVS